MIRCPVCASLYSGPGHDCAAAVQERVRAAERAAAERMRAACIAHLNQAAAACEREGDGHILTLAAFGLRALPLDP